MKNVLIGIVIFVVFIGVLGLFGGIENTYTRECTVIEVTEERVLVIDSCGFVWDYLNEGIDKVNDNVTLIMYDNGTSNIDDDMIKKVER